MKSILSYIRSPVLSAACALLALQAPTILLAEGMNVDSDFERIGEPKPGEWLFHHYEPGQSLEEGRQ